MRVVGANGDKISSVAGEDGIGRRTWIRAQGPCRVRYTATVEVERPSMAIDGLAITPLRELPAEVVPYLWPSRYCESDRFEAFAEKTFGIDRTRA